MLQTIAPDMDKRNRRIIFISFCALFVIAGSFITLYAAGYTFSLSRFSIEKTGALYLKFSPEGWTGSLNDKPIRDASRLLGADGLFIKNLPPETYSVSIAKPGFLSWHKDLSVEPGLVTKADQLILIPDPVVPASVYFSDSVARFWFLESGGTVIQNKEKALRYVYNEHPVELKGNAFIGASKNGSRFITTDVSKKRTTYYLYDTGNIQSATNISLIFENLAARTLDGGRLSATSSPILEPSQIRSILPHPFDQEKWVIADAKRIAIIDMLKLEVIAIAQSTSTSALATDSGSLYYANATGVYRFDFILKATRRISDGFGPEAVTALEPLKNKMLVMRGVDGSLALLDESGTLQPLAHTATLFAVSGDSKKIAFVDSDGTLNIHYREDSNGFFRSLAGDTLQLKIPKKSTITGIAWYANENYLIVYNPNGARLIELDEQDKLISYDLPSFDGTLMYLREQNKFFGLRDGAIFEYELE
jgi:hypothetical protein